MQRIVNRHYADPKSTRDITGITPEEFSCIIAGMQTLAKAVESIFSVPDDQIEFVLDAYLNATGRKWDAAKEANMLIKSKAYLENMYAVVMKILEDINQPYPGAIYPSNSDLPLDPEQLN